MMGRSWQRMSIRRTMLAISTGVMLCAGAAEAARSENECLNSEETQAAISQRLAITPNAALKAARFHVPGGEALRARLCHHNDNMVYWVTVLGRDSKVTRVLIRALDGSMVEMR